MAKGQQSGWNSITVWMIVFVGLWLTSTVVLVILYTGQEDMQRERPSGRGKPPPRQPLGTQLDSACEKRSSWRTHRRRADRGGPVQDRRGRHRRTGRQRRRRPGEARSTLADHRHRKLVPEAKTFAESSYHEALQRLYTAYKTSRVGRGRRLRTARGTNGGRGGQARRSRRPAAKRVRSANQGSDGQARPKRRRSGQLSHRARQGRRQARKKTSKSFANGAPMN